MTLDDFKVKVDEERSFLNKPFYVYAPHIKGFMSRIDLINFINRIQQVLDEDERISSSKD